MALKALKSHYEKVFVDEWPAYTSAILLGFLIVLIFAWGRTWGVQGGLANWGDWFNSFIGLDKPLGIDKPESPLRHPTSLMSLGLLLGAFAAALMAKQFSIRIPPALEMVKGVIGGTLMGFGATMCMGCNVGGFISPVTAFNMSGWGMWVGMTAGAAIGIKILWWEMENITWGRKSIQKFSEGSSKGTYKPFLGILIYALAIYMGAKYLVSEEEGMKFLGGVMLIGLAFGVVLHRSRFCFARVFRDPLMTGDASMTKAAILMLLIGVLGNALLIKNGSSAYYDALTPVFWLGSVLGGMVFAIGMIAAGGCATGALWRMGEGQIKLWIAVFFFAWTSSWWKALLTKWGILAVQMDMSKPGTFMTKLGHQFYMPREFHGWTWTLAVTIGLLILWFVVAVYNEATERFTVIK